MRLDGPGLDGFGPLGLVAENEHRLAERWAFFLHPARVGQDQERSPHQGHELEVADRLDQADSREPAQGRIRPDSRTEGLGWTGKTTLSRGSAFDEVAERLADFQERLAEALAAVGRDQDHAFGLGFDRDGQPGGLDRQPECVDPGIAGDVDRVVGNPFAEQVEPGYFAVGAKWSSAR